MTRQAIGGLITLYQRYISPYKGFRCAYGIYYGGSSCSAVVKRIVLSEGLFGGWSSIVNQFRRCRCAYNAMLAEQSAGNPGKAGAAPDDDEPDDRQADKEKKKRSRPGICPESLAAVCIAPDPSDCGIGSACGGVADGLGSVCSCF